MLQGITFSNLSTKQKNLKAQKKINHVCQVLEPGHSAKEALPSASCGHSAKIDLCRVPRVDTWQRLNAVSHPNGRRTAGTRTGHVLGLCRVRARWHSAKSNVCRVPYFADGQLSAKLGHAVCHVFAECPWSGTRQRPRHSAIIGFPVVRQRRCLIPWTPQASRKCDSQLVYCSRHPSTRKQKAVADPGE